jgi:putative PIN family toxin of toxin-antitoxin system
LRIVLDTNVLVSGLIRADGVPARILDLVLARQVGVALDHRILAEYETELNRPEFGFPSRRVGEILEFLWLYGERVRADPLPARLPDPDDAMFLEVAASAHADGLVTGNLRHFPPSQRHGVRVLTPREWLQRWTAS